MAGTVLGAATVALVVSLVVGGSAIAAPAVNDAPLGERLPAIERPASFADLISEVSPAVVNIAATRELQPAAGRGYSSPFEEFFDRFFGPRGVPPGHPAPGFGVPRQASGSGFVVGEEGTVVTNYHVVEGADEVTVTFEDGSSYEAEILGVDPKTDLAVLDIDGDEAFPYVAFGDSDATRVGDWVVAIGNPFGLGGTATVGIVSARGRDIQAGPFDDFLQVDAPINSGNSGGPLFDTSGRVVGINTAIFSPNGGNVGIGFAIPAAMAMPVVDQLRETGRVERGWLGVSIQSLDDEIAESLGLETAEGALVAEVVADSPAQKAGLRVGDVILDFDGVEIGDIKDLTRAAAAAESGSEVDVEVWRDGKARRLEVEVGSQPESMEEMGGLSADKERRAGQLGLSLAPLTDEDRANLRLDEEVEGVLVAAVRPGSPAFLKGLRPGDVITQVGSLEVERPADVVIAIEEAREGGGNAVLLRVLRGGAARFVALPLE